MSFKCLREFLGGFYFESEVQETFTCKRNSWRNDAISSGGGGGTAVVHAEDLVPENSSDNTVEVTETDYIINGETTIFNDESFSGIVYGGYSRNKDAINNTLIINSGIFKNYIYGGYSELGNTIKNTLIINGGTINNVEIYGGAASHMFSNGSVIENTLIVNDGTFNSASVYGGYNWIGDATKNTVIITNGNFNNFYGSYVHGGCSPNDGNATYNTVNISGGFLDSRIYGGLGGDATNNTVTISGGTINGDYIYGGLGGNATKNTVNISGGTINNVAIYGGSSNGNTTGNRVNIEGGNISSGIYAGYSSSISGKEISNNIIKVSRSPVLTSATLIGGFAPGNTTFGNTLEIHTTGLTAKNIANFDIINFYLPSNVDTTTPVLTLSATNTDISGAQVLAGVEGNANLNNGDVVTLLTNAGTITDTGTTYGKLTEGVSLEYDLTISKDGDNKIIATIGSISPTPTPTPTPEEPDTPDDNPTDPIFNPKTKILTKFPIQPQPPEPPPLPEPIIDFDKDGLSSFFEDIDTDWTIFADGGFGPMRYKVNNGHIDTTNQNADLGLARKLSGDSNLMTIAPIIDYQNTNYDSYLNNGTRARGNSKYTGGGFVLRNMNKNGFYFETSLRGGKTKTDFASEDLDTTGNFGTITYDTSQTIWNGHLKLGKYLRLNKNNLLHVYGFYYHTHQGGSNADLSSGEHYNFSNANAGRARIGYRMTTRTSKISQIYTGLAYQFEHNSGVKANYKGYSTSGESHNGSSGMLELGWIIKPLKDNPWAVDINATGWIGNQRGVKAMAKIQKSF